MSELFKTKCSLHLKNKEDLLEAIKNPEFLEWQYPKGWEVKSDFIIDVIDQMEKENRDTSNVFVQRQVEKALDIEQQDDNNSSLARLVYNAQSFYRSEQLILKGYQPLTDELLCYVGNGGQIAMEGDLVFPITHDYVLNVREIQGKIYAIPPRKRRFAVSIKGQPVKIIKKGKINKAGKHV